MSEASRIPMGKAPPDMTPAGIARRSARLLGQRAQLERAILVGTDAHTAPPMADLEDAPDPDQPNRTVRRYRVQWVPDVWRARGKIGQPEHDAAVRYHDAYALGMLGVSDRDSMGVAIRGSSYGGVPDAQLCAAADYRDAERAVGPLLSPALAWCVLSTGTVQGWAEARRIHPQRADGLLAAALDRLAYHFGY